MAGKFDFTPEQQAAITLRGSALLCSAAAGSGKTRVLVERLLRRVTDPNDPQDVDSFLVITYTKAAAAELRDRITDGLYGLLAKDPASRRLRRQIQNCARAQIGTIHSFCASLLRESAHELDISPDFRVLDESESDILKAKVLEDVLEERYERMEPDFVLLADTMGAGRDDTRLVDAVLDAHKKLRSHPNPEKWAQMQAERLSLTDVQDLSETVWGEKLMAKAMKTAYYWQVRLKDILGDAGEDFYKAYGPSLEATKSFVDAFISGLGESWDSACERALPDFPRPKPCKGYEDLKQQRLRCKKEMEKACAPFCRKSESYISDMRASAPVSCELLKLVLDFDAAYSAEKKRRAVVDFSDQEHLAVRLLVDPLTGEPTPKAVEVASRFTEVMADEYQDVNAVQELILQAVSDGGKKLFMVGDVRQSIYRFRLADPTIFLDKYRRFAYADEAGEGQARKVILPKNFRSRAGVLNAVNFVFENIMSEEFGEMDYTERERLIPGAEYPETDEKCLEFDVLDMGGDDGMMGEDKSAAEAAFAAKRIRRLLDTMQVSDGAGGMRPMKPSDAAILIRSASSRIPVYTKALRDAGIPVASAETGGFFASAEVSYMMSLLSVVDNPRQDVPLVSVLRGPVWAFSADELAEIRLCDKRADFYDALCIAAEQNEKCRSFLNVLNDFRSQAPDISADRLIWRIYEKTGLIAAAAAMPGGDERRRNLMRFFECACRFEESGYKGLFAFITHMRLLEKRGDDPTGGAETVADGVHIMSIHKSKGLEFPIVLLCDTARQFNLSDAAKPLIVHPDMGIGAKYMDTVRRIEYPTAARLAVAETIRQESLAEELRVLYVAMTRAREKLIITAAFDDAQGHIEKLLPDVQHPVSPQVLSGCRNMADWLLLTALLRPESGVLRNGHAVVPHTDADVWDVRLVSGDGETGPVDADNEMAETHAESAEDFSALEEKLNFKYPYAAASMLPSKLTATELKGRYLDSETAEEAFSRAGHTRRTLKMPHLGEKRTLDSAQRGTAQHLFMQYADFEKCAVPGGVETEKGRLVSCGLLSEEQARAVNSNSIRAFFCVASRRTGPKSCKSPA